MTANELVGVLWLFCGVIGGIALGSYLKQAVNPKSFMERLFALIYSMLVGLALGPIGIGLALGDLLKATDKELSEKADTEKQTHVQAS